MSVTVTDCNLAQKLCNEGDDLQDTRPLAVAASQASTADAPVQLLQKQQQIP